MLEALNMQLEPVRTVLSNEVNQITVCVDLRRATGVFYTVISITATEIRRQVARLIATAGLFTSNNDFIGSFSQGEALNLVFLYRGENRMGSREALFATNFIRRKQIAEYLLLSCAETQISGSVGLLLLEERNINLSADGQVYFNYFLDFKAWIPQMGEEKFLKKIARYAFAVLSREYALKYEQDVASYPSELQVFYRKIENNSFLSIGGILTFVKMLPDNPLEPRTGIYKLLERCRDALHFLKKNSMVLFIAAIVLITIFYTSAQIYMRISSRSAMEKSTTYIGLDTIGEVYLGDENV